MERDGEGEGRRDHYLWTPFFLKMADMPSIEVVRFLLVFRSLTKKNKKYCIA